MAPCLLRLLFLEKLEEKGREKKARQEKGRGEG